MPSEANVSPHAAERVSREAAQKSFDEAARSLNIDWKTSFDGRQIQRWAEALGRGMVRGRDHQTQAYREGRYPPGPANAPQLLVIGMDGGRWQGRQKDPETGNRWRENKVLSVSSYVPGDGREGNDARKPAPLVRTHLATSRDAAAFGTMARVEAERRGYRQALTVIAMGDGGNWIDPLLEREFRVRARIIDWYHAVEHLWDCAKAVHGPQGPKTSAMDQPGRPMAALLGKPARLCQIIAAERATHPVSGGWPLILASLKSLLETGEPLEATWHWHCEFEI